MFIKTLFAFVSLVCLSPWSVADEPMRCGQWVVTSQATVEELVTKCGAPASKDVRTEDIYVPGAVAGRTHKIGVKTIERWTFDRGKQSFRMIATVIDGKLHSIDRAE